MTQTDTKLFGRQTHVAQQPLGYVAWMAEKSAWLAVVVVMIYAHVLAAKLAATHTAPSILDFGKFSYSLSAEACASFSLIGQPLLPVAFIQLLALATALGFGHVDGIELISSATGFALWFSVVFLALGLSIFVTFARHDAALINPFGSRRVARGLGELK
jgi:hypothetical protein